MLKEQSLFIPQGAVQPSFDSPTLSVEPITSEDLEEHTMEDVELDPGTPTMLPDSSPDPSISRQYKNQTIDMPQRGDPSLHRPWPWK